MTNYSAKQKSDFADIFDALGHPRRIAIFLVLKEAGATGVTFGALAKLAHIADPSLSHHLRMMKKSGLVKGVIIGQFTEFKLDLSRTKQALIQLGFT